MEWAWIWLNECMFVAYYIYTSANMKYSSICIRVCVHGVTVECVHIWNKLHPNKPQLDLCSSGSSPTDTKREGRARATAAQNRGSSPGERRVQRAHLALAGPANTAHLPLQCYFHMISISKSLLPALAFSLDKRREEGGKKMKERRREISNGTAMDF